MHATTFIISPKLDSKTMALHLEMIISDIPNYFHHGLLGFTNLFFMIGICARRNDKNLA